jgi:aryl-alcohol dehydrogenase-like predicted oxidoreductase
MATTTPPRYRELSSVLPPLILGTATFNTQYVSDPLTMPSKRIVSRALELGVRAFDTSPYYGPSELLLGAALSAVDPAPPRSSLTLITKAGRVGPSEFDYSAAHIRRSVRRSLERLNTDYLDLVYAHDVEFVTPAEVVTAVTELRRLRDEDGSVRHVGISGYPVDVLCDLAELVFRKTGEPLDAVMSYGNFTVQNRTLGLPEVLGGSDRQSPLSRLRAAGVDVVLNASMLGMGLLTTSGIPPDPQPPAASPPLNGAVASPLAIWHPSPPALRLACQRLSELSATAGERLESVAIRWSLGEWARIGGAAGVGVPSVPPMGLRVGATVMGVTSVGELEETVSEWNGARDGLVSSTINGAAGPNGTRPTPGDRERNEKIVRLVEGEMWSALGAEWLDYSWASPGEGYVNQRVAAKQGAIPEGDSVLERHADTKVGVRLAVTEAAVSA